MAPSVSFSGLFVLMVVISVSWSCPLPTGNDSQILNDNPHLRNLFLRYAEGGTEGRFMSREGLERLVRSLGGRTSQHDHPGDDHVTHDHHPEDHKLVSAKNDSAHSGDDPTPQNDHQGDRHRHEDHSHDHGDDHSHDHDHPHDRSHHQHDADDHHHHHHHESSAGSHDDHDHGQSRTGSIGKVEAVSGGAIGSRKSASAPTSSTPVLPGAQLMTCGGVKSVLEGSSVGEDGPVTASGFLTLCPGLVNYLDQCGTRSAQQDSSSHSHHHHHSLERGEFTSECWVGAVTSMIVIGLVSLACIIVIPALKRGQYYEQVNQFLLALAVGTLAGDALIHLLPHAISMEIPENSDGHVLRSFYGFTALGGIILFLFLERGHNMFCGHGHSHGHPHELPMDLGKSKEELDKETVGTATTIEDSGSQNIDRIGEKLSKHSKHNSFIYAESTMTLDAQNCFEGCNSSPSSDANGNAGSGGEAGEGGGMDGGHMGTRIDSSTEKEKDIVAERERLVTSVLPSKSEMGRGELSLILDTPTSPRPKVLRQNSSNFNMVLQEYHVGHHGHSHHGHSHVTGRKDSLRAMILVGDALHTILDGMAIGAAYGTSLTGGVATSIAVLCHELPHKVGDFALLFEMGMKLTQALKMLSLLWMLSLVGVIMGVLLGSIPTASPWIYSFTAGVFIYLALVDLLSELSVNRGEKLGAGGQMLLQGLGMFTGASIMLLIAIYEHDIEDLINGSF